jgi:ethanolamine utilization protein EutP
MGPVFSGKTTLCQCLADIPLVYIKTHSLELIGNTIDTPGEYLENRLLWHRLKIGSADAGLVLFLQDCTNLQCHFAPGQSSMFACPAAGVITKIDLGNKEAIRHAGELLTLAGAAPRFAVSLTTGEGMETLRAFIGSLVV